jgi:hypothetical protein
VTTPRTGREEGTCERSPVDRCTQTLPDGGRMSVWVEGGLKRAIGRGREEGRLSFDFVGH